MRRLFLYFLCVLILFTFMSCDYSKKTMLTRRLIGKTNEMWKSDDGHLYILLDKGNPQKALIVLDDEQLSCFCLIIVRGAMFFTTVNVYQSNSDYVRWQNSDDYDILKFDYSISDKCDQLTATVIYDWLDKYGYEKLYNEGDVVTFRYYSDTP